MPRRDYFTCPKCGGHYFGTNFPNGIDGVAFGQCHGGPTARGESAPHGCGYEWNRDDDARLGFSDDPKDGES